METQQSCPSLVLYYCVFNCCPQMGKTKKPRAQTRVQPSRARGRPARLQDATMFHPVSPPHSEHHPSFPHHSRYYLQFRLWGHLWQILHPYQGQGHPWRKSHHHHRRGTVADVLLQPVLRAPSATNSDNLKADIMAAVGVQLDSFADVMRNSVVGMLKEALPALSSTLPEATLTVANNPSGQSSDTVPQAGIREVQHSRVRYLLSYWTI